LAHVMESTMQTAGATPETLVVTHSLRDAERKVPVR
jgi:hypothetical protein